MVQLLRFITPEVAVAAVDMVVHQLLHLLMVLVVEVVEGLVGPIQLMQQTEQMVKAAVAEVHQVQNQQVEKLGVQAVVLQVQEEVLVEVQLNQLNQERVIVVEHQLLMIMLYVLNVMSIVIMLQNYAVIVVM